MRGRVKILFVIDHLGGGGAEQQFVNIVNNVSAEKYVYLTEGKGIRAEDLDRAVPVGGGHGKRTPVRSTLELKGIVDSFKPDIVHAFLMYSCFITALCLKISRHKPLFIAQEFSPPEEILAEVAFPSLKKTLLKLSYRKASLIITVSRAGAESFARDGYVSEPGKTRFIYDGLDIDRLNRLEPKQALREKLGLSEQNFYITFVGSLVRRKGVEYLIRAFKSIEAPHLRLIIIGEGPQRTALAEMAGDDPRIEFLGYRKNGTEYIKASDIFVLPSLYEGLPNVIIEAMAVGTPVIATEVSGIPELIEEDVNGLLVPPKAEDSLREAILRLVNGGDRVNRLVAASLEKAGYFSVLRMARDYENLYHGLLKTRGETSQ